MTSRRRGFVARTRPAELWPARPWAIWAVWAGLLVAGCSGGEDEYPPTPEGVFMARCSRCHEIDGSSTTASKQAKRQVDFRKAVFQESFADEQIREIAVYGTGKMQGIAGITETELDSVIVHVRRLGQPALDGAPSTP